MRDSILLSICIPTYNRASYLNLCLERVIDQVTIDMPVEIIVSDNRAKLSPITLKASESMRLVRLSPTATYREQTGELNIAIPRGQDAATYLVGFMQELVEL